MKNSLSYSRNYWFLLFPFLLCFISLFSAKKTSVNDSPYICPYCDLSGQDFSGKDLTNANLSNAILTGADFSGATLIGASLFGANLEGANFDGAIMGSSEKGSTCFALANLTKTSFQKVSFKYSDLQYAVLTCADFSNSDISNARFGSLPRFQANSTCQISFRNATMNCEFSEYWDQFDLTGVKIPNCKNQKAAKKTRKKNKKAPRVYTSSRDLSSYDSKIYVSQNGSDSASCGQIGNPCLTIQKGIDQCNGGNCAVLVQVGFTPFVESNIQLADGVSLFGGYDPQWNASVYQTAITSSSGEPIFVGNNLTDTINIHGFYLSGSTPNTAASASVVVQLNNSNALNFSYCDFVAAPGSTGANGAAGTKGNDGGDGGNGGNPSGGKGGLTSGCAKANGGAGGDKSSISGSCHVKGFECKNDVSVDQVNHGYSGGPGTTNVYASGGTGGSTVVYICPDTSRPGSGPAGGNGKNGSCGSGGAASTNTSGSFSDGTWQASRGGSGNAGGIGGGGGGGGSGGSCAYCDCGCGKSGDHYAGTSGGGGGGGACGGSSPEGGLQGGASFAIVLLKSTVSFGDSISIRGAHGGNGGSGGNGMGGGIGGKGGNPSPSNNVCNDTGGAGSAGGKGGNGGASGGGAGGNGGPSIGIALADTTSSIQGTAVYYLGNSGTAGSKGNGGSATVSGACTGGDGVAGVSGLVAEQYAY